MLSFDCLIVLKNKRQQRRNSAFTLRFNLKPSAIKAEHMDQTRSESACAMIETAAYNVNDVVVWLLLSSLSMASGQAQK